MDSHVTSACKLIRAAVVINLGILWRLTYLLFVHFGGSLHINYRPHHNKLIKLLRDLRVQEGFMLVASWRKRHSNLNFSRRRYHFRSMNQSAEIPHWPFRPIDRKLSLSGTMTPPWSRPINICINTYLTVYWSFNQLVFVTSATKSRTYSQPISIGLCYTTYFGGSFVGL
jgi:hypothetical protein